MKKFYLATSAAAALTVFLSYGEAGGPGPGSLGVAAAAAAQEGGAEQLRRYISQQVGGLQNLTVPDEAHLPQPLLPDGTPDPLYLYRRAMMNGSTRNRGCFPAHIR